MAHAGCLLYAHVRDPRFLDSPWFLVHLLVALRWHKIHLWKQGTDSGYRIKGIVLKSTWFMTNYQLEIPVWQLLVIRAAEGNLRNTGTLEGDWKEAKWSCTLPSQGRSMYPSKPLHPGLQQPLPFLSEMSRTLSNSCRWQAVCWVCWALTVFKGLPSHPPLWRTCFAQEKMSQFLMFNFHRKPRHW